MQFGLGENLNSYIRKHLGSFWFHLGPVDPRLKQVSRLFPDRVKPLLQMYWMVEPTVKWGPDSTRLLCSTFPGSVQDTTGWTDSKGDWLYSVFREIYKNYVAHAGVNRPADLQYFASITKLAR